MTPARPPKHWAAHALAALALALVFVASAALGLALHANLPPSKRLAARIVQDALAGTLRGRVALSPIDSVSLSHVALAQATLFDVYDKPVLEVQQVRVDLSLRALALDLIFGAGTGKLVVSHVEVRRATVTLRGDPKTGQPTLVAAVAPASATKPGAAPANGPEVFLPSIEVAEGIVRSRLPAFPRFRARLRSVRGSVHGGPDGVRVDVDRFGISLHQADASYAARGTGTFAIRAPGPLRSTFEGFIGDVEVRASATLDGAHLDVTADAPRVRPASARALVPDWPLTEAATAHAEVRGDLPHLSAHVRATAGPASVTADGPVDVGDATHADLVVSGRHLDARAFAANAPPTDVSLDGTLKGTVEGDHTTADATLSITTSSIGDTALPPIDASAHAEDGDVKGTVKIHEPGATIQASFELHPSGALDVEAESGDLSLSALQRFGVSGVRGRGRVRARAHLEGGTVKASVDGDVGGFSAGSVALGQTRVHLDATGPIAQPERLRGSAHVDASSAVLAGFDLDHIVVNARGAPGALDFDAELARTSGPSLKAEGKGALAPRPLLEKTRVVLEQGPVRVEGDVASLDLEQGRADVDNVRVVGAGGTITGNLRIAPELLEVVAEGEGVNLDTLSRALGLPRGAAGGTMRVSTNLVIGRDVTRGHVALGLGNATIGTVGGLSLQLTADLDDHHLTGGASGLVAAIGTFGTTFDVELGGSPLALASWKDATGSGEIQVSDLHLALLGALLPPDAPVSGIAGRAYGRLLLERKKASTPLPSVFATVSTKGLALSVATGGGTPLRVAGIDLTATGQFDATTGDSTGTTLAADAHGDLFAATGAVRVDVPRFVSDPTRALAQLLDTPVDIVLTMPARELADLPEPLRGPELAGQVSGTASLRGTFAKPTLFASVQGRGLSPSSSSGGRPIDVHGDAQYEWTTHAVAGRATATVIGRDVATVSVRGTVPAGPESFRGTLRLALDALPVEAFASAARRGMSGSIEGAATLTRDERGGAIDADVRFRDAFIEHTPIGDGSLRVTTSGAAMNAELVFEGARGSLEASGNVALVWPGPLPSLDPAAPVKAHLTMHDFAAAALSPATASVLSRLGGRLDADLALSLTPSSSDAAAGYTGGVEGSASLREGTVLIDALGLNVNDLTATAQAHGTGGTTSIAIRDVAGKVRSSKTNLRGTADLVLEGVRVMRGTAELDADDMPILFRGAPQGRITGRADARLTREADRMQVDIEVPTLTMALPQSSTRNVQELGDNPDVSIVQLEGAGAEEPVATPWRLALHLGNNVSLRRADVDLRLTGTPILDLGETAVASGSVDLVAGGRIPVLGKVFSVEDGKAVFDTGDPSNPHVLLHAVTHAANDSLVYVEVTGTMRDAKIALRSDPPLPEAEVFALLLGGSAPDSDTSSSTSNGPGAGAVAIGTGVSMGVNQLVANSPVEVRVDTTEQNQPRYTAAVRIRENLWFEASEYQQAEYGVETSTRNVVAGTVDYRFTRRWSLRTQVGTAGGALDLLWQYRY